MHDEFQTVLQPPLLTPSGLFGERVQDPSVFVSISLDTLWLPPRVLHSLQDKNKSHGTHLLTANQQTLWLYVKWR